MNDQEIFNLWEEFKTLLKSTNREGVDEIIKWLDNTDFKFAPASTQYHNSFRGGLLKHSLDVYYNMYDLTSMIQFFDLTKETIIIASLLHDVCKVECYKTSTRNVKDESGQWIQVPYYTFEEVRPWGHGGKSVIELLKHGLKLTDVEISMINNHMGFTEHCDPRTVTKCFSKCPQSLVLHIADMMATFVMENDDLQTRYKQKLLGRNLTECEQIIKQKQTIIIDGYTYKLAPDDSVVDDKTIIQVHINRDGMKIPVKVYSPHGDGLPI